MKTMTIIAYKNIPPHSTAEPFEWDGFLKKIESALKQEKGIERPLENVWQIPLGIGLCLLPVFHSNARPHGVRIGVLVSEADDSTISVL
jgi:hypothetical protein